MNPAPKTVRIVLVDDHPIVREHLANAIRREADLTVCGEAASRAQALEIIAATKPDLAIIDLSLKDSHGLDLIKDIHVQQPDLGMLVLSMHDESIYAERVIRAGAHGYITKQEATRKIIVAIRQVLAGEIYLNARAAAQITQKIYGRHDNRPPGIENLSDRELVVFELIADGLSVRQISEKMSLDAKTIETYRARIKEKFKLKDADEVRQFAIHWKQQG
jgi:DNA-binding NarL/FixJ family response regulator